MTQKDMLEGHCEGYCRLVDSSRRDVRLHIITSLKILRIADRILQSAAPSIVLNKFNAQEQT
jgi:hypothetical protein